MPSFWQFRCSHQNLQRLLSNPWPKQMPISDHNKIKEYSNELEYSNERQLSFIIVHSYSFLQFMVYFGYMFWIVYALIQKNDKNRFYIKIYALVGQSKLWQVMQELIEISVQFSIKAKYCINCTLQMQILYKILFFEIKNIHNLKYKCSWILNSS